MPDYAVVDAFTALPFGGNPAAVVFLENLRGDAWMQRVAAEFNLSETAFVRADAPAWSLRWFTPRVEVNLCGHATLAAAHALWDSERLAPEDPAIFWTRSGELRCTRDGARIAMDFPANPPKEAPAPDGLLDGLGVEHPAWVGRCSFDYIVVLDDPAAVAAIEPDFRRLAQVKARGVAVTAPGGADEDFVSRFFAPSAGVDEDPVTGSAHTMLGPYWAQRLGRDRVVGRQISARSGLVDVAVDDDRVTLRGSAVSVARGELLA